MNTVQILLVFDPCACSECAVCCAILDYFCVLNQIEEGENEYPNKIHEVPVNSDLLDHLIRTSSFIGSENHVEEDNDVQDDPHRYVETVETGNEEEEIREQGVSVFVVFQVGSFHHPYGFSVELLQGSLA